MKENPSFHYPTVDAISFGRAVSTALTNGTFWIAVQMEKKGQNTVAVIRTNGKEFFPIILNSTGFVHQPHITPKNNNGIVVVWNETNKDAWNLKCAFLNGRAGRFENIEEIFSSKYLCLPPTAAYFKDELWVAWPGIKDDSIRINVARRKANKWRMLGVVSKEGIDAFRPSLASSKDGIFLTWDQYNEGKYEVAFTHFSGFERDQIKTLSRDNERWFCPKAVSSDNGAVYLAWVVIKMAWLNGLKILR